MTFSLPTNKGINPIIPQRGFLIGRSSGRVPNGMETRQGTALPNQYGRGPLAMVYWADTIGAAFW